MMPAPAVEMAPAASASRGAPRGVPPKVFRAGSIVLGGIALGALALSHASWGLAAAWALCLLVSFVGWGGIFERLLNQEARVSWALRAVWGMSAVLLVGGVLSALHLGFRPVLLGQVIIGILLAGYFRIAPTRADAETITAGHLSLVVPLFSFAFCFAALHFFGHLGSISFQPSDDPPLYFLLPEKLLQTGTMYDPLNVRRVSTYGGQCYLHALFLTVAPHRFLHVVDGGIGLLLLTGLVLGDIGRRPSRVDCEGAWLALFLLFALANVRVNTASLLTGCAVFVAMYQTLRGSWRAAPNGSISRLAGVALIGFLTAAAGVLRTSNEIAAVALGGLGLVPILGRPRAKASLRDRAREFLSRDNLGRWARDEGLFALAMAVFLAPWMLLLRESCGTSLYPLIKGNLTPGFVFIKGHESFFAYLHSLLAHLLHDKPLSVLPLFFFAGLLPSSNGHRSTFAVTASALVGFCVVTMAGGSFDPSSNSRYYFAIVTSFALIMVMASWRTPAGLARLQLGLREVVLVVAVLGNVFAGRSDVLLYYQYLLNNAQRGYRSAKTDEQQSNERSKEYREIQMHLEEGKRGVMMIDEPYRFDFRRNALFSMDIGAGMGPAPGYPAFKGPEALESYLREQDIQYIVYVDFAHSAELYQRASWQSHLNWKGTFLQGEAPYMLDAMDSVDKLAASHELIYSKNWINVVDLTRPRAR